VSNDLQWLILRNYSCFQVKCRNGPVFTSEPNNLTALNSFKYSGLANRKVVGVTSLDGGVALTTRRKVPQHKVAKATSQTVYKRGARRTLKAVGSVLESGYYRRDLKQAGGWWAACMSPRNGLRRRLLIGGPA